jgi:hypothetical protein
VGLLCLPAGGWRVAGVFQVAEPGHRGRDLRPDWAGQIRASLSAHGVPAGCVPARALFAAMNGEAMMAGVDVHEIERHRRAHEVSDPKAQQVPIEFKGRIDVRHH